MSFGKQGKFDSTNLPAIKPCWLGWINGCIGAERYRCITFSKTFEKENKREIGLYFLEYCSPS